MAEYEMKFTALSRFAVYLVDTEQMKCMRFHMGLAPRLVTKLLPYREKNYADLVDMARKT